MHDAPTGFDWGFGGSGPADFALNVLALFLPLAAMLPGARSRVGYLSLSRAGRMPQELREFETYLVHKIVKEKWCGDDDGIL